MALSFCTQANALLRKNLTYQVNNKPAWLMLFWLWWVFFWNDSFFFFFVCFQKRNYKANVRLVLFPVLLCLLFAVLQYLLNRLARGDAKDGPLPDLSPVEWPPLLQVPESQYRAVMTTPVDDLHSSSCRKTGTCPATVLFTGSNQSLGEGMLDSIGPLVCGLLILILTLFLPSVFSHSP